MRILIVNRAMGTLFGGGEAFDSNAARYLAKRGNQVSIVTGCPSGAAEPNDGRLAGLNITFLQCPNLRQLAYKTEHINRLLSAALYHLDNLVFETKVLHWLAEQNRYREFDVVQACSLFWLPAQLLRRWEIPTVSWLPGNPSSRARRWIQRLGSLQHYALFTHGDPVAYLKDIMKLDRFRVIEPGIQLNLIDETSSTDVRTSVRNELGIPFEATLSITVCRLVPIKNVSFLIHGLSRAMSNTSNHFHIVLGDGPLFDALRTQVETAGLSGRVRLLGFRPSASVYRYLRASDFFVLTSNYENYSIAVLEAMANGLPVIGTEVGYLKTLIKDSGAGVTVPPRSVEALANAITKMASHPDLRAEMGTKGIKFGGQHDWDRIATKLESLYKEVIGS